MTKQFHRVHPLTVLLGKERRTNLSLGSTMQTVDIRLMHCEMTVRGDE